MLGVAQPKVQNASDLDINIRDEQDLPTDTISSISWAPSGNNPTFATADWASYVRIYNLDPDDNTLTKQACFDAKSPCLSVKWHEDEKTVFAGCTDGSVKLYDIASGNCSDVGNHEGPVKSMHWFLLSNALLTLSFDKTLRFWDPRQTEPAAVYRLDHKIYCSDVMDSILAIGLSEAKLLFADLNNIQAALTPQNDGRIKYVDSQLGDKTQVTSIKLYKKDTEGFGISGNDGRCHISNFRGSNFERFDSVITFKSQKVEKNSKLTMYPMNTFGFHPSRGNQFVYTCGGEGRMYFWDLKKKDRIADFDFKEIPVTQAEMDPSGKYMAYALGYDWARGIQGYMSQPSKVCVHVMKDQELEYNSSVVGSKGLKYP